jgi:hypothetical protein
MSVNSIKDLNARQQTRDTKTTPEVIVDKVDTENSQNLLLDQSRKDSQMNMDVQNGSMSNRVVPELPKTAKGT